MVAGCREGASVSPAQVTQAAAAWPAAPAEGFVVLPWGTRVYLEPRYGGASARLGWPSTPVPPWPATGHVARVVGQRDGFVEIAPIMPPSLSHCGPLLDADAFDVRLYVSPWALAPVLDREVEVRRGDGSMLLLRPGAVAQPIAGDDEERWAVWAGGIRVRARLPADAVARAYSEVAPVVASIQGSWQLPEGRPYAWDGWPLELAQGFGQDVTIASVTAHEGAYLVELTSPCARVVVRATEPPASWGQERFGHIDFGLGGPDAIPPGVLAAAGLEPPREPEVEPPPDVHNLELEGSFEGGDILGVLSGPGPTRLEHVFEEGAPVYLSLAGPPAGTLSQLRAFFEEAWVTGDRLCFHTAFGARFDPPLPVCMPMAEDRVRNPATDVHDFAAGVVRPGALRITGTLPEPEVARALRRHRKDLRRCLNEAMLQGVPASGGFELTLDVSGKGIVTAVRPRSTLAAVLTDCAVAAARGWTMPTPADGKPAQVVFSVRFEPR